MQLLKGSFVLVATWAISTWFNLYTLKWLMNQMFTFGVLPCSIIFQPELRRALEQLGRGKLFSRTSVVEQDISERINAIIKVAELYGQTKNRRADRIRAEDRVEDYMESGIRMESIVSSELLINIFIPNTPLHDGAVIIGAIRSWPQAVICLCRRIRLSARSWVRVIVRRSA